MKQIKKVLCCAVSLLIVTACGSTHEANVGNPSLDSSATLSNSVKNKYLTVINNARRVGRTCGSAGYFEATSDLHWSDKLYKAAYEHSNDMASSNTFSHSGSGGVSDRVGTSLGRSSSVNDRIEAYGYSWQKYAENIGAGTDIDSAEKIVTQLLKSDGHCANIMDPLLEEVAMAVVKNSNSTYTYYWTQNFGTPIKE